MVEQLDTGLQRRIERCHGRRDGVPVAGARVTSEPHATQRQPAGADLPPAERRFLHALFRAGGANRPADGPASINPRFDSAVNIGEYQLHHAVRDGRREVID
jgi:hypothetical protein